MARWKKLDPWEPVLWVIYCLFVVGVQLTFRWPKWVIYPLGPGIAVAVILLVHVRRD